MPQTIYKGDLAEVTLGHETGIVLTHGAWGGLTVTAASSGDVTTLTFSDTDNHSATGMASMFDTSHQLKYPKGLLAGSKLRVKGGGNYGDDDHTKGNVYTIIANEGTTLTVTPAMNRTGASAAGDEFMIETLGTPTIDVGMAYNSNAQTSDESVLTDQFIGLAAEITLPETKVEVFRSHIVGVGRQVVVQEPQHMDNEGGSLSTMMHSARWLYYALGNEAVSATEGVDTLNVTNQAIGMGDTYIGFASGLAVWPGVGDYVMVLDSAGEVLTPYTTEPASRTKWTGTQTQFHSSIRSEVRRVVAVDTTTNYVKVYVDDPFNFDHAAGLYVNLKRFTDDNTNNSPNFLTTTAAYGQIEDRQSRAMWSMWHQPSFCLETSIRSRDVGSYGTEQTSNAPGSSSDSKQLTRVYKGCKVKSWQLTADADSEVKMKVDFDALLCYTDTGRLEDTPGDRYTAHRMFENIGNGPAERKEAGIAPNTEKPFFFYNGTITAFGTNLAQVTKFELGGENNIAQHLVVRGNPAVEPRNDAGQSLEQIPFAGSRNPSLAVEGKVEYNLKMEILPTDPLLWHEFRSARSKGYSEPITLHLVKDGAGSNREEVYVVIDDYIITEAPLQIPEDKGVIKHELTILPKHVKIVAHDSLFHC
jgi:hypothetical protein